MAYFNLGEPDSAVSESGEKLHHCRSVIEAHRGLGTEVSSEETKVAVPVAKFRKSECCPDHPMETGAEKTPKRSVGPALAETVHQLDFEGSSIQEAGEFEGIELPVTIGIDNEREPGSGEEIPKGGSVAPVSCVPERPEFRNVARQFFEDLGGPVSASIIQDQNLEVTTGTPQGLLRPVRHPTDGPGVVEGGEAGAHAWLPGGHGRRIPKGAHSAKIPGDGFQGGAPAISPTTPSWNDSPSTVSPPPGSGTST